MLTLSRRKGESVLLMSGSTLLATIKVGAYERGSVKLHIHAPAEVIILRDELIRETRPQEDTIV